MMHKFGNYDNSFFYNGSSRYFFLQKKLFMPPELWTFFSFHSAYFMVQYESPFREVAREVDGVEPERYNF